MIGPARFNSLSKPQYWYNFLKTFDNPNTYGTSTNDYFGYSVSICENYFIVGAYEDGASGAEEGKAYIYSTSTGSLLYTLNNPNPFGIAAGDYFGATVSICNNYAIVGAPLEGDSSGTSSGKAYIYSTSTGSLLYTLNNPNPISTSTDDNFGISVAICDNYAIVGARGEDASGVSSSGKAYIYSTSTGSLLYTLDDYSINGTASNDNFGEKVAICNEYSIVAAPGETSSSGAINFGAVHIYSNSTGNRLYSIINPDSNTSSNLDKFGSALSISSNYAIVGAYTEYSAGVNSSGLVYVYSPSTGSLLYTIENPEPTTSAWFGNSVSNTNNRLVISSRGTDTTNAGKIYLYDITPSTFTLLRSITNPNAYSTPSYDYFGYSVSISDTYLLASAHYEDDANGSNSGKVYWYKSLELPATYSISVSPTTIDESGTQYSNYTVNTTKIVDGTILYYKISINGVDQGTSFPNSQVDTNSTATVTINSNVGTFAVAAIPDVTTEGNQTMIVTLYSNSGRTNLVATANPVTITDTSLTLPNFTWVQENTSTTTTLAIPGLAQAGDYAFLFDFSTTTTNTVPAGWTLINGASTTGIRTNVSYRVLAAGEAGTSITGMAGTTRKLMIVFRPSSAVSSATLSTVSSQATTAAPTNQSLNLPATTKPHIAFAVYGKTTSTLPTRGWTQTGGTPVETSAVLTSGVFVKYQINNAGSNPQTATISMTDAGTNTLQSFTIRFT